MPVFSLRVAGLAMLAGCPGALTPGVCACRESAAIANIGYRKPDDNCISKTLLRIRRMSGDATWTRCFSAASGAALRMDVCVISKQLPAAIQRGIGTLNSPSELCHDQHRPRIAAEGDLGTF